MKTTARNPWVGPIARIRPVPWTAEVGPRLRGGRDFSALVTGALAGGQGPAAGT